MIRLQAGDWRAVLNPALGGSVAELEWLGRPVLRPTPRDAVDPLQTACFPLVPYANRIADGRFVFGGRARDVGVTPGFEPHALHGLGWRRPWEVERADPAEAVLTFRHPGGGEWPWAFSAGQRFQLSGRGLRITLSMTNQDSETQPAGLGLHPYLNRLPDDRLTVAAPRVWRSDDTLIPRERVPAPAVFDWSDGPAIADAPFVDNAYEEWSGLARLVHADWSVTLASPGTRRVHVYAPRRAGFVCIEPVSHRPNALNASADEASGLVILEPGQTLSLSMTIGAGA
ncbi:aldose 1-epimerase [Brevundimonas sp.]|uniref:aldose 1-epimerase n=1 Tax=Brevundimonas sp. TaxID=1871086 RepID=UPI002FC7C5DD